MPSLAKFFEFVDTVNRRFADLADYMVLFGVLISATNATVRYLFAKSSNAFLEAQWFTFLIMVLAGSAYVLRVNEHVRVDIIYANISNRGRLWVDTFGLTVFLLPATIILTFLCYRYSAASIKDWELSSNAGGLPYWPIKMMMPLGFFLLTMQGLSELNKRVLALRGLVEFDSHYEKPLQ